MPGLFNHLNPLLKSHSHLGVVCNTREAVFTCIYFFARSLSFEVFRVTGFASLLHDDKLLNICWSILADIRLTVTCWPQSSGSSMSRMASSSSRIWCLMRTLTDSGDRLQMSCIFLPGYGVLNAICVCSTGRSLSASADGKWRFPAWWWWETWPSSIQSLSPTRKPSPNCRTSRKIRNCSGTALCHRYGAHRDGHVIEQ